MISRRRFLGLFAAALPAVVIAPKLLALAEPEVQSIYLEDFAGIERSCCPGRRSTPVVNLEFHRRMDRMMDPGWLGLL